MTTKREPDLPLTWTELGNGLTRQQIENVLQFSKGVTAYLDGKPVAVIVSVERYQSCHCPDHMRDHA